MSDLLVYVQTIQAKIFGALIDSCKDIVHEVNMIFSPSGIEICAVDTKQRGQALYINLDAAKFDAFTCETKYTAGVNMVMFAKILKSAVAHDIITISINRSEPYIIFIQLSNPRTGVTKEYRMKSIDLDTMVTENASAAYIKETTVQPMMELHTQPNILTTIFKDLMSMTTSMVTIGASHEELQFTSTTSMISGCHRIQFDDNANVIVRPSETDIFYGQFSLNLLLRYTKFAKMSCDVKLSLYHLKDDEMVCIKYTCADLGHIYLMLSQQTS